MSRVLLPGHELLVLGQNTQFLDALVAEYNRQTVNTGAGHPRCKTFLENFHSLRHPEGPDRVRNGQSVNLSRGEMIGVSWAWCEVCYLYPGPDQVQWVGDEAGGTARHHGSHALHHSSRGPAWWQLFTEVLQSRVRGEVRWGEAASLNWPDINCRKSTRMRSSGRKCRDLLGSPWYQYTVIQSDHRDLTHL